MGLWFKNETNIGKYFEQLRTASTRFPDQFDVYTPATMPKRYHFSNNKRIAPIYVVPRLGYALARRRDPGNFYIHGVRAQ
jgi:hypothetical protein